jgi:hypothetical protein
MTSSIGAGLAYFGIVLAVGFLFGGIRVLLLAPAFGELAAVIIELPVILAIAWIVCSWLLRNFGVPATLIHRFTMGGVAFVLLMIAEFALATLLFGNSLSEHLGSYRALHRTLGLAGQMTYGTFPIVQR